MTETSAGSCSHEQKNLAHLQDAEIECVFELGRTVIELRAAKALKVGDLVTMDRKVGEPHELRLNGVVFAYGEVVVMQDRMVVRITSMTDHP
jgi:flagellar motor switch protein FliN/FliY